MMIVNTVRELSIEELDQVTGGCTCGAGSSCIESAGTQSFSTGTYAIYVNCSGTVVGANRAPLLN
jgi:bacteriocin-like protein